MLMIDLGKHAAFILWSYGFVFATIVGLIFWLVWDGRRQERKLTELEKRGIKRRSAQ